MQNRIPLPEYLESKLKEYYSVISNKNRLDYVDNDPGLNICVNQWWCLNIKDTDNYQANAKGFLDYLDYKYGSGLIDHLLRIDNLKIIDDTNGNICFCNTKTNEIIFKESVNKGDTKLHKKIGSAFSIFVPLKRQELIEINTGNSQSKEILPARRESIVKIL